MANMKGLVQEKAGIDYESASSSKKVLVAHLIIISVLVSFSTTLIVVLVDVEPFSTKCLI